MVTDIRLAFFNALWGDSTLYRSVWYGTTAPNQSKWFKTNKEAIAFAEELAEEKKYNIYHACALFDKEKRTQESVDKVKALWLDIDLKSSDCESLKELGKKYLPLYKDYTFGINFWVISSGNGFHLYWIFENPIDKETWKMLATDLHEFNKKNNIPVDPARTRDCASLLRFPYSWNIKGEPKEVKIILIGKLISNDQISSALEIKTLVTTSEDFAVNEQLSNIEYGKSDAELVAQRCPVIKQFKEMGLEENEPARYKAISVVRLCEDGEKYVHEYFSKHSRYTKEWANQKMANLKDKDVGPALCESFKDLGVCGKCKHHKQIKSPIQLGVTLDPISDTLSELTDGREKKRAEMLIQRAPTQGWLIGKGGIYRLIDDIPVLVCTVPFYIIDLICEDFDDMKKLTAVIRAYSRNTYVDFKLPLKHVADDKVLLGAFYSYGIFPINKKHLKEYLIAYFQRLDDIIPQKSINSLGWQPDSSFVYSFDGMGINTEGKPINYVIDRKMSGYAKGFKSKGSLDEWKKIPQIYNSQSIFYPHLFTLLCSLGAPLLSFTAAKGIVLSLQGPSGTGKTLALKIATSVWGDPYTAGVLGTKDTHISMVGRLAALKNLPLTLDEATLINNKMLSGLVYELVNGRGRSRATTDGSLSNTAAEWQTITITTTNRPLLENSVADISEAERYRILELEVGMPSEMAKLGAQLGKILESNYGLIGKKFIDWVIINKEATLKLINGYTQKFQALVDDDKRFWVCCGAVAFTAATIANELGLITIDLKACYEWFVGIMEEQTDRNKEFIRNARGFETREEFIHALKDSLSGFTLILNKEGNIISEPQKEIKARIVYNKEDDSFLYVRAPVLTEFIKQHFVDSVKAVKKDFKIADATLRRIGPAVGRYFELKL